MLPRAGNARAARSPGSSSVHPAVIVGSSGGVRLSVSEPRRCPPASGGVAPPPLIAHFGGSGRAHGRRDHERAMTTVGRFRESCRHAAIRRGAAITVSGSERMTGCEGTRGRTHGIRSRSRRLLGGGESWSQRWRLQVFGCTRTTHSAHPRWSSGCPAGSTTATVPSAWTSSTHQTRLPGRLTTWTRTPSTSTASDRADRPVTLPVRMIRPIG